MAILRLYATFRQAGEIVLSAPFVSDVYKQDVLARACYVLDMPFPEPSGSSETHFKYVAKKKDLVGRSVGIIYGQLEGEETKKNHKVVADSCIPFVAFARAYLASTGAWKEKTRRMTAIHHCRYVWQPAERGLRNLYPCLACRNARCTVICLSLIFSCANVVFPPCLAAVTASSSRCWWMIWASPCLS